MQPSQSNIKVKLQCNFCHFLNKHTHTYQELRIWFTVCCGVEVVINGAAKEIGRAAVVAVTNARGMEVAGAVDSHLVGQDIGEVSPHLNCQLYH